jgi:hypothetical protein
LASTAVDGSEHQLLANSVGILVEASGAIAALDFRFVDGVQGANGTSSLEDELVASASELANSAAAHGVSSDANAFVVGDDLVSTTGVAVSVLVEDLVNSALAHTNAALKNSTRRASAATSSIVDQSFRTN